MGLREIESRLPPGFRFHPSDEELVCYYLRNKVAMANHQTLPLISPAATMVEVDLHAREPWELPAVAKLSADEWYFFSFRDRKYTTGSRTNRATKLGYWKATGKDKMVHKKIIGAGGAVVGMRKTLVFYFGRAPNGRNSGWVMHEFRLHTPASPPKEGWVLCRVFSKGKAEADLQSSSNINGYITGSTAGCISNGPSSSSPPAITTLCSRPAAASAVDKLDCRRLLVGSSPIIDDDDDDQDSDHQLIIMHQQEYVAGNGAGSDAQLLLDSAMLRAADSFLELEQGVAAAVGVSRSSSSTVEMGSLATSCAGVPWCGSYSADGVFF